MKSPDIIANPIDFFQTSLFHGEFYLRISMCRFGMERLVPIPQNGLKRPLRCSGIPATTLVVGYSGPGKEYLNRGNGIVICSHVVDHREEQKVLISKPDGISMESLSFKESLINLKKFVYDWCVDHILESDVNALRIDEAG